MVVSISRVQRQVIARYASKVNSPHEIACARLSEESYSIAQRRVKVIIRVNVRVRVENKIRVGSGLGLEFGLVVECRLGLDLGSRLGLGLS